MKCSIKEEKKYILELSEEQAQHLKSIMQNPLFKEEDKKTTEFRESLFSEIPWEWENRLREGEYVIQSACDTDVLISGNITFKEGQTIRCIKSDSGLYLVAKS